MDLAELIDNLSLLDDWEERYRYIIELGRTLEPLTPEEHNEANKVRGCASQVWLVSRIGAGADPILSFRGDSDAHIVKGLIALALAAFSGKPASAITAFDAQGFFERTGLKGHLSPQRSNGLFSMIARIKDEARQALAAA